MGNKISEKFVLKNQSSFDWSLALNQFEILCGDFKYDLLENKK
ncbi:hypothetical protein [Candidatus Tisiphia endosymbiont of Parasteatoda lunata]